jgi:outer membrane receptor protein involved in Fe transport
MGRLDGRSVGGQEMQILRSSGVAAALVSLSATGISQAQAAKDDGGFTGLQEVVVTATKREETLQEVPVSITTISSKEIETLGVQRVEDYLDLVPGLSIRDHGSPGYGTVIIRGLNTGSFQSTATVAYYFDDTPFTATGSLSYGAFVTPDPDISDIERIEVLKGPQGTLYGASSLGGLVRLISKEPTIGKFDGSVHLDGSTVNGGSQGYGIRGVVNIPLNDDTLALRLSGMDRHMPGWVDNVFTGKEDRNSGDSYGGRAALLWKPRANFTGELDATYQYTKTNGLDYTAAISDTDIPKYGYNKDSSPFDQGITTRYTTFSGKADWDVGPGDLIANASYAKYDVDTFIDFTDAYGYILTLPFTLNLTPGTFATPTYGNLNMKKYTYDLRFVAKKSGNFEYLAGLYDTFEETGFFATVPIVTVPGLQPFPPPIDNLNSGLTYGHYDEFAGYGDLTYYIVDNVDITGGVRVSHNHQEYAQSPGITILQPTPGRQLPEVSDTSETYLATLRWRPTDHIDTYARAASGYRPGGPGVSQDPTAPATYQPDKVWNYELGVKATSADNRFTGDLAVFQINWNDIQIDRYDAFGLPFTVNGGKAKVDGVELDLAARPIPRLVMRLNAGYMNARITEADPAATIATGAKAGDPLPLSPKTTAALLGDYTLPVSSQANVTFGASLIYQSSKQSSYEGSPSDPNVEIPSYTTVDLRTGFNVGRVDVQLRADNIFNEHGIATISSYKVLNNPNSPTWISYIRPATLSLTVGMTF